MAFGEEWSVYEERESGCYRKLRECETGLLIRKRHCEMFLKHYTCVLKCFKTLYHKQRLLSSGQSHWFLIPSPTSSFIGIHREPGKRVAIADAQPAALNEGDLPPRLCSLSSSDLVTGVTGPLTPVSQTAWGQSRRLPWHQKPWQ